MSVQEILEIREREQRLRKTPLYVLVASGFLGFILSLASAWFFWLSGSLKIGKSEFAYCTLLVPISFLLYSKIKQKREMEILELEILKLKCESSVREK